MTAGEMATLAGYLVSVWVIGFCGGFILTRFKEALNHVS